MQHHTLIKLHKSLSELERALHNGHMILGPAITAVLIWGPSGCGKTSMSKALSSEIGETYFINKDTIMEKMMETWFHDTYIQLKTGNLSHREKEDCFWTLHRMKITELGASEQTVLDRMIKQLGIPAFTDEEFKAFKKESNENVILYSIISLLIFLAKRRRHNFIEETTGNTFNMQRTMNVFGDKNTHSILHVVFVSSVGTLFNRVSARHGQLMNPPHKYIAENYYRSYHQDITLALQSEIFKEIIVTSNDNMSRQTMLHLKRNFNHRSPSYDLIAKPTWALNSSETAFLKRIMTGLGLPESWHLTHTLPP